MSAGRDLVHHVGGGIAQHAFGADIEYLDDALRIGGDAGEVGAVEDGVLQGACLVGTLGEELGEYVLGDFKLALQAALSLRRRVAPAYRASA